MTIEVIDLLSSPEQPKPSTGDTSAKEKFTTIAKTGAPTQSLTYEHSKRANEEWFTLSSDSEAETIGKPDKPVVNAPSKTAQTLKPGFRGTTKPSHHLQTSNHDDGVYFQSDDFDSTINLDDTFELDVPRAKKRRLSPSPEIALLKPKVPITSGFQRSVSNIESSRKLGSYKSGTADLRRSKTVSVVLESDPIVFTSSPDPFEDAARRRREKRMKDLEKDDDDDEDDIFGLLPLTEGMTRKKSRSYDISDGSPDLDLPDLNEIPANCMPNGSKKSSLSVLESYNAERAKEKKAKEAAQKRNEKQASKQAKLASKEAEKERKRLEREEKANEKERLAELARVNVVRTNKQRSSHEMIVDLPSKLSESELADQVLKLLGKAEVKHSSWESSLPLIKWRREVSSEFNEEMGQWEPVAPQVKPENHIMFVLSAKEFVELATSGDGNDIDAHVLRLKAKFSASNIIYLIEGLTAWMRKNKTIQNRKFTETVRQQNGQDELAASQRPKKKKQEEYVDEDLVEDALLRLQVMHGALIHHTAAMVETAEWILVFTQHISTIPYRLREQSLDTTFCMESGQVRSGENAADTFTRMLQEMNQITAAVAYGIAAEYPTVRKLVEGLEQNGPLALEDCKKTANRNGAFTDRRVGPSISKRLHKVFTGRDEMSMNV